MRIFSNGINPLTKQLLIDPIDAEQFGMFGYYNTLQMSNDLFNISNITNTATSLRFNISTSLNEKEFMITSPNLNDPKEVGWTFLVHSQDPNLSDIIEIIQPLAKLRNMEDTKSPLLYNGETENEWFDWKQNNYDSLQLRGKKIPQYILIVGNPTLIPFKFQSMLDSAAYVGRIDFDLKEEIISYIEKVVNHETNPINVSNEVIMMGTNNGINDPTYYSANYLVKPIAEYVSSKFGFKTNVILSDDATKINLVKTLKKTNPAFIFTATHGAGFPGETLLTQKKLNGGIYCHDEGNSSNIDDVLLTSYDIPEEPFLEGSVFFQFACFGYGTPKMSDFEHWQYGKSTFNSDEEFVADLPKKLLSHQRGPIAYIGHVDKAWLHGFDDPTKSDEIIEKWNNRITPFITCCESILSMEPIGRSLTELNKRYDTINAILTNIIDQAKKNRIGLSTNFYSRLTDLFITRSDAQNYMVFGDPAVNVKLRS